MNMRLLTATGLALALATSAWAGPEEPVGKIMDLATALWSEKAPEGADYFDQDHITLYARDFLAAYREAQKYPVYDGDDSPFGYDVITNSQDGCPLKDVSIVPGAGIAGTTDVKVTFKMMSCYDDQSLSELHFKVVTEDGKPVISDIDRIVDGKPISLLAEMKNIAQEGAKAPANQQEPQQQ